MKKISITSALLIIFINAVHTQQAFWKRDSAVVVSSLTDSVHKVIQRFENQIIKFEAQDSLQAVNSKDLILFVGSSSFRIWKNMAQDFAGMNILNRGFGGATFVELNYYFHRIVRKYQPQKIVVYCGENDMTLAYSLPEDVLRSFITFDALCKIFLPNTKIYFVSIKPSPRSWFYWPKIEEANMYVANYIKQNNERLKYIEIKTTLLDSNNVVRKDLFLKDGIHMKQEIYPSWAKIIKKALSN